MDLKKLQALYGLKWNPFARDLPIEALQKRTEVEHFCWRVENLVMDGGFALITGDPGAGKSAALRMLADRLGEIREVLVCEFSRPQSRVGDFYREMGSLFNIDIRTSNRYGGHKALREKWQAHIESTCFRPVIFIDEAQQMDPFVLTELRLLSSARFDTKVLLTVVLCGDDRLTHKLKQPDLLPIHSRLRTQLVLSQVSRDELIGLLTKALVLAGNPALMTEDLIATLAEHAAGNPRAMMIMADELLCEAARLELLQLDTKFYLEFFSQKGMKAETTRSDAIKSSGLTRRTSSGLVKNFETKGKL
jgi:general secretion pathway protein A